MRIALFGLLVLLLACGSGFEPLEHDGFLSIGGGTAHTCGLQRSQVVFCWGLNGNQELGVPGDNALQPTRVGTGPIAYRALGVGRQMTCGLTSTGRVICWGDRHLPQGTGGDHSLSTISVGLFGCGLDPAGNAWCWDGVGAPAEKIQGGPFHGLSVGGLACALAADSTAHCWSSGETTTQPVPGGLHFAELTAGDAHQCGLNGAGAAYCWGDNASGQLGDFTHASRPNPGPVATNTMPAGTTFQTISAGGAHTCAIATSGQAWCWGAASHGQLGYGASAIDLPVPVAVTGAITWAQIDAGGAHTCALDPDGVAYCWGENTEGQLGNGAQADALEPVAVKGEEEQ